MQCWNHGQVEARKKWITSSGGSRLDGSKAWDEGPPHRLHQLVTAQSFPHQPSIPCRPRAAECGKAGCGPRPRVHVKTETPGRTPPSSPCAAAWNDAAWLSTCGWVERDAWAYAAEHQPQHMQSCTPPSVLVAEQKPLTQAEIAAIYLMLLA